MVRQLNTTRKINYCRHLSMPSRKSEIKTTQQKSQYFQIYPSESCICVVFRASVTCRNILYKDYLFISIWKRPFCSPRTVTNMAIRTDWSLNRLKFASAHEAISSVTCITDDSPLYSTYILKRQVLGTSDCFKPMWKTAILAVNFEVGWQWTE